MIWHLVVLPSTEDTRVGILFSFPLFSVFYVFQPGHSLVPAFELEVTVLYVSSLGRVNRELYKELYFTTSKVSEVTFMSRRPSP